MHPTLVREAFSPRGRQAEDSANDESAFASELALDPASGRTGILRDEPLLSAFLHHSAGREFSGRRRAA